ncbi:hypothetical protein [Bifidobacterium sp. ESL0800]|uniref:hypothetical protein n=1 Tax=Bifidobacterium sp. ESL0800 TaxID=2983236 RepID=UPI0023F7645B|nr:hypothetical protein [Bifidobacterium sp. ESL0800]WEV76070.1 hypothetical protein OZX75_02435 [Bifidobacterium sp. ESL0800]
MYETNKVDAFIMWAAKILEWFNIVASVVLLAGTIYLGVGQPCPSWIKEATIPSIYGFTFGMTFSVISHHLVALGWYAMEGIAILLILAYAFHNLSAAFKTLHQPVDGQNPTPFQSSITKNIHVSGICFIVVAVLDMIVSFVMGAIDGASDYFLSHTEHLDSADISNAWLPWLIIGIFILCITRILRYGEKLQQEYDELI